MAYFGNESKNDLMVVINSMALYVYLKKGTALEAVKGLNKRNDEENRWCYKGMVIYSIDSTPYFLYEQNLGIIHQIGLTDQLFLKATIRKSQQVMKNPREFGVYVFGKARAKLSATGKFSEYLLEIETSSLDGFADMETIEELILSGSISPVLSFSSVQKEQSLFNVLNYILSKSKLSVLQRFVLCWKLSVLR